MVNTLSSVRRRCESAMPFAVAFDSPSLLAHLGSDSTGGLENPAHAASDGVCP